MHRRDAQIHTVMATDGEATESGCPSGIQSWAWRAATVGLGPILEDSTNKNVEANKNGEDLTTDLSY